MIALTELIVWEVSCSRCDAAEHVTLPPEKGAEDAEALLDGWSCGDEHLCPECVDDGAEQAPQVWAAEAAGSCFRPVDDARWFGPLGPTVDDLEVNR